MDASSVPLGGMPYITVVSTCGLRSECLLTQTSQQFQAFGVILGSLEELLCQRAMERCRVLELQVLQALTLARHLRPWGVPQNKDIFQGQ